MVMSTRATISVVVLSIVVVIAMLLGYRIIFLPNGGPVIERVGPAAKEESSRKRNGSIPGADDAERERDRFPLRSQGAEPLGINLAENTILLYQHRRFGGNEYQLVITSETYSPGRVYKLPAAVYDRLTSG